MLKPYRHCWRIFFCFILSILGTTLSYANCDDLSNAAIQKILDVDRLKYAIPGLEVSISCPDEAAARDFVSGTTLIGGYDPVRPEHLFQIGHNTQSFMAVLILKLEAEGRLSIKDPMGKYLRNIPSSWQKITIEQLLRHTSGIVDYLDLSAFWTTLKNADFQKQWSADELVAQVFHQPLLFTKDWGFVYHPELQQFVWSSGIRREESTTNYVLLGMIAEAVTGTPLDESLRTYLFEPLKLVNTYYLPTAYQANMLQHMVHGYSDWGYFGDSPTDITLYNMSWFNAAGAIITNAHDLAGWYRTYLTSQTLLPSPQRKELMMLIDSDGQPLQKNTKADGYGLGINYDADGDLWWYGGGTMGYRNQVYWLKRQDVLITVLVSHVTRHDLATSSGSSLLVWDLIKYIRQAELNHKPNNQSGLT